MSCVNVLIKNNADVNIIGGNNITALELCQVMKVLSYYYIGLSNKNLKYKIKQLLLSLF